SFTLDHPTSNAVDEPPPRKAARSLGSSADCGQSDAPSRHEFTFSARRRTLAEYQKRHSGTPPGSENSLRNLTESTLKTEGKRTVTETRTMMQDSTTAGARPSLVV